MAFEWLFGSPSKMEYVDLFTPQQQRYQQGIMNQTQGYIPQAGQFYQNILGGDTESFNMMAAPYLRNFQQQVAPSIAERFAGGNSFRSSGFNQAIAQGERDLQTNLAAMGAGLQQQAAQGLTGLGQLGAGFAGMQTQQPVFRPQTPGALDYLAKGIGSASQGFGQQLGQFGAQALGSYLGIPLA